MYADPAGHPFCLCWHRSLVTVDVESQRDRRADRAVGVVEAA